MRRSSANQGQVILEFTFCMIVIMIMIFGVTKAFFWTGNDLARRRLSHDERMTLFPEVDDDYLGWDLLYIPRILNLPIITLIPGQAIARLQIDPNYHIPVKMDAIWNEL